ncbi:MAG: hypothetical protein ACI4JM_07170 [Oscillospiraceae bacterium]
MIKTINLSAGTETEVELTGGCQVSVENRGTGIIYASKSANVVAGADGVTAIDSGNAKVLRNVAQYRNNDNSYDYYGKIYLLSDSDTKAEIQTANDLNFFSRKNSAKGGETIDAYTKAETDIRITEKVAEIVADAPEDFDTLKEMSDWIAGHENDAAAMNSAIQTNANNISSLQTDKVGFTDYASTSKAGIVKVNNTYGTGMNNNTLELISATEDDINAGSNDWKPITPYKVPKVMKKYGINSETQITEMQEDIANKVDNDIFVAENLIHYPYNNDTATSGGITFTDNEDGSITLTGSVTKANTNYNYKLNPNEYTKLEIGQTYILNNCGNLDDDCYLRLFYKSDNGTETYLASTKSGSYTFVATETINEVRIWITANCDDITKEFNNTIKPMLEVGSVAHAYQPYSLSRKAMRDDINTLMALLT